MYGMDPIRKTMDRIPQQVVFTPFHADVRECIYQYILTLSFHQNQEVKMCDLDWDIEPHRLVSSPFVRWGAQKTSDGWDAHTAGAATPC